MTDTPEPIGICSEVVEEPKTDGLTLHAMVDIETLGTDPQAPILSIGITAFNANGVVQQFYVGVDLESNFLANRMPNASTLMWWLDPKRDAARREWALLPKVDLASALFAVVDWITALADQNGSPIGALFGKGSTFDNVILRNAASSYNIAWPWSFRQDLCYRTLQVLFPDVPVPSFDDVGIPHSALADSHVQALHLLQIASAHGVTL